MLKLRRHAAYLALTASVGAFVLAFQPLYHVAGPAAGVLVLGPVLVAAWSFGLPVVLVTSVVVAAIQTSEYTIERNAGGEDLRTTVLTTVAVALVGLLLSYARGAHRSITRLIATDAATGLLNRASFVKILDTALTIDERAGSDLVVVDLVHFRQIT